MSLTPHERSLRARLAAETLHAHTDGRELTAPARAAARRALEQRLLDEVDPDRMLAPAERERRLTHARKAHFLRLALRSAETRRRRAARRKPK